MSKGANRNEPCSCGSGKKYKKCHESQDSKYYNRNAKLIDIRNKYASNYKIHS